METRQSLYEIPYFVKVYCQGRFTEIVEYLTESQYIKLFRIAEKNPDIKIKDLGSEKDSQYIRCLITRRVLPLTVMKNPILLRAAELEYKTYNGESPISLQEARWILIDEFKDRYPEINTINQPTSCLNLIRKRRGQFKLCLTDCIRIADERRQERCIA